MPPTLFKDRIREWEEFIPTEGKTRVSTNPGTLKAMKIHEAFEA
ncbi:MAG: hypothetical protein ACP5QI_02255 [Candidatus Bathyarchaeia archaeon]